MRSKWVYPAQFSKRSHSVELKRLFFFHVHVSWCQLLHRSRPTCSAIMRSQQARGCILFWLSSGCLRLPIWIPWSIFCSLMLHSSNHWLARLPSPNCTGHNRIWSLVRNWNPTQSCANFCCFGNFALALWLCSIRSGHCFFASLLAARCSLGNMQPYSWGSQLIRISADGLQLVSCWGLPEFVVVLFFLMFCFRSRAILSTRSIWLVLDLTFFFGSVILCF